MSKIHHPILGSFIFVHSLLDDAGLSANEFRVYAHIARRAGSGSAFPAVASIADVCRIHKDTVWAVLRSLEERGMLVRESRAGLPNVYKITEPKDWTHPSNSATRKEGSPETEGWGSPETEGWGVTGNGGVRRISKEGTPSKDIQNKAKVLEIPLRLAASPEFVSCWTSWLEERKARRKPVTLKAQALQLKTLATAPTPSDAVAWIEKSIANGWTGIFPDNNRDRKSSAPRPLFNGFAQTKYTEGMDGDVLRF